MACISRLLEVKQEALFDKDDEAKALEAIRKHFNSSSKKFLVALKWNEKILREETDLKPEVVLAFLVEHFKVTRLIDLRGTSLMIFESSHLAFRVRSYVLNHFTSAISTLKEATAKHLTRDCPAEVVVRIGQPIAETFLLDAYGVETEGDLVEKFKMFDY